MKRRDFVKKSSLATAGGVTILNFPVFGKNAPGNKVVVAIMGVNSRGSFHAKSFSSLPNVEVGYICDVEDGAIKNGLKALQGVSRQPIIEKDIRKLVKRSDFDALVIAAPDHWHAPAAILALANGKNVYVEKPCSHNPHESEMLIQAAGKSGKIVQVGSQRRSFPSLTGIVKEVHEGLLGETYMAKSWYTNSRKSIGIGKVIPVPSTLDFDLWQGPAPRTEFKDNIVHYNWHWHWIWGTGESCNNGNHELDCCRWFLGVDYPTKVTSAGGRYAFSDDWETPDTQIAAFEFGNKKVITWEGRSCNSFPVEQSGRGFIIYGTKGTLVNLGAGDYKIFDEKNKLVKSAESEVKADPNNPVSSNGNMDVYHLENFVESIRGNTKNSAPIEEGHKSVILCHLSNIAQRTGSVLNCDPSNGNIISNDIAAQLWSRQYEKGWEPKI